MNVKSELSWQIVVNIPNKKFQYLDEVIRILLQKLKTSKYFKELIFNTLLFADDQFITKRSLFFI